MFSNLRNATKIALKTMFRINNGTAIKTAAITFLTILNVAANLGGPFILLNVLPLLTDPAVSMQTVLLLVSAYGATWGLGQVLPFIRDILLNSISMDLARELTNSVTEKYFNLPPQNQVIRSSAIEVKHLNQIYEAISPGLIKKVFGKIVPTFIEGTAATVILFRYYSNTGFALLGLLGSYITLALINSRFVRNAHTTFLENAFKTYADLTSLLEKYKEAHYNGRVEDELKEYDKTLSAFSQVFSRDLSARDIFSALQNSVTGLGFAGIAVWAAYQVKQGRIQVNDFIWITFYLAQFAQSLNKFSDSISEIYGAYLNLQNLLEYLNQDDVKDTHTEPLIIDEKGASIKFSDIHFYHETNKILAGISFEILPKETIAIVGPSGCGKSTIINLLFGFLEPLRGTIEINDQNISKLSKRSLRKKIAIVSQSPLLFNDTVEKNIRYSRKGASEQEIKKIIKIVELKEFLQSYGHNKPIGEKGAGISGGQAQRVAIARALIKETDIIVLDEATSALDAETEKKILDNFGKITRGEKTVIIITHKLHTVKDRVDRIIVMEQGKITAISTYDQLSEKEGIFSKNLKIGLNIQSEKEVETTKISILENEKSPSNNTFPFWNSKKTIELNEESKEESETETVKITILENKKSRSNNTSLFGNKKRNEEAPLLGNKKIHRCGIQ